MCNSFKLEEKSLSLTLTEVTAILTMAVKEIGLQLPGL